MKKLLIMTAVFLVSLGLSIGIAGCNGGGTESAQDPRIDDGGTGVSIQAPDNNADNADPELDNAESMPVTLAIPANLNVSAVGRLMTVTWDAVPHASGYIVHTASVGCGSGNRIVNTATKTAANHSEEETNSAVAEQGITTSGSGFVTFTGETSFTIWLMAESNDPQHENVPMANALTAKIMAISDDGNYIDSEYSGATTLEKADYLPASN